MQHIATCKMPVFSKWCTIFAKVPQMNQKKNFQDDKFTVNLKDV